MFRHAAETQIAARVALRARRRDVLSLVIGQAAYLLLIGTVTGMALAWGSERAITAMSSTVGRVNSTSSSDPTILIGAPDVIGVGAAGVLFACPQVVNISPVAALRQE